jgi:hypothetical protein
VIALLIMIVKSQRKGRKGVRDTSVGDAAFRPLPANSNSWGDDLSPTAKWRGLRRAAASCAETI